MKLSDFQSSSRNLPSCPTSIILFSTKYQKLCLGNNATITTVPCVQPKASSVQLKEYSQHRLAYDNALLLLILHATSKGVDIEFLPIVQAPISIDVDVNNIQHSSSKPDLVVSSNNVASVTGSNKMFFISPRGESVHKEELLVSQVERDVHHCIKLE